MKAYILTPDGFELREVDRPQPGANDVLVRTAGCGICEGDTFTYKQMRSGALQEAEILLGHEGSGVVEAVGSNVSSVSVGDRVTSLGGAYAEFFVSPESHLQPVPESTPVARALGEPIACFVHAANRFGTRLGDRVALIGCGFMGLGCLQLARMQGSREIVAIDLIDWRLAVARTLGADRTVNSSGMSPEELLELLGEFDIVIEATGVAPAVELSTLLVKQHGTVVFVGYHQSEDGMRTVDMKTWNFKAITVVNGHVRRDDEKRHAMLAGLDLVAADRLQMDQLATDYPAAQVEQAFQDLVGRTEGLFKGNLVF